MAKILTSDYFVTGDSSNGTWSSPGNLINGNYLDGASVLKGGKNYSNHVIYNYRFAIGEDAYQTLNFVAWPDYHSTYTINISLYYGNQSSKIKIGNTWQQKFTHALTPNKPENGGNPIPIDFGLSDADRQTIDAHRNELILELYCSTSYTGKMMEIDINVPDSSKIYVGNTQASAVYVGTTKASAVYVGTTKVL